MEKSIHHFHIFVSWLTLVIARNVAMMTQRIDEVQVGVASRGLRWRWSNQMWHEVGLGWTEEDLMKVIMLLRNPIIHLQKVGQLQC